MSDNGRPNYSFGWIVKTSAVREQTFPSDRSVSVEHQYKPIVGGGYDTILRKPLRQNKALATEIKRYRTEFCFSDSFLTAVDKLAGSSNNSSVQERRINYILSTGANWAGPIKSFKLVIDPGGADRLASLCTLGMKATSPNALEFIANDFTPNGELKLLLVGKF
jgi:hypothetical protein